MHVATMLLLVATVVKTGWQFPPDDASSHEPTFRVEPPANLGMAYQEMPGAAMNRDRGTLHLAQYDGQPPANSFSSAAMPANSASWSSSAALGDRYPPPATNLPAAANSAWSQAAGQGQVAWDQARVQAEALASNPVQPAKGLFEQAGENLRDTIKPLGNGVRTLDGKLGEMRDNARRGVEELVDGFGRPLARRPLLTGNGPAAKARQIPAVPMSQGQGFFNQAANNASTIAPNNAWSQAPPPLLIPGQEPWATGQASARASALHNTNSLHSYDDRSSTPPPSQSVQSPRPPYDPYSIGRPGVLNGQSSASPSLARGSTRLDQPIAGDQVGRFDHGVGNRGRSAGAAAPYADAGGVPPYQTTGYTGPDAAPKGAADSPAPGDAWAAYDQRLNDRAMATRAGQNGEIASTTGLQFPPGSANNDRSASQSREGSLFDVGLRESRPTVPEINSDMLRAPASAPLDEVNSGDALSGVPFSQGQSSSAWDWGRGDETGQDATSLATSTGMETSSGQVPDPFGGRGGTTSPAGTPSEGRNAFAILLAWVLLSGSAMGNLYLFWSYMDVRTKYRMLARKAVRPGGRLSAV